MCSPEEGYDRRDSPVRRNLQGRACHATLSGFFAVNSPASVRARLLNISKQSGEDFQSILTRYAMERFLYRVGAGDQRESFVLKGATLFIA